MRRPPRPTWLALVVVPLLLVCGAPAAWAQSASPGEVTRPAYQVRRFDEDWSVLKGVDRTRTDDGWDRVKFIPLTDDQTVWVSVGGQVRERLEYFHEFNFGASTPKASDGYLLSRIMLDADLHLGRYARVYVEGKSALATDRDLAGGATNLFVDTIDLQNGFLDLTIPLGEKHGVTLRGGRQELLFGKQRLVSPLDWTNVRRTFDGASAIGRIGDWTVTPFWTQLVPVDKYEFNTPDSGKEFFGVYAAGLIPFLPVGLDLYYLGADNATATFNGTSGREERHTLGGRLWGKVGDTGVDYEVEGAYQFGTVGAADIGAFMVTAQVGYALPAPSLAPRVYVNLDYASGDDRAGGDVQTFNQLYPLGHQYLGYMDFVGRQNVIDLSGGVAVRPTAALSVSLEPHVFWRASDQDALYNAGGAVLRSGAGTTAREIGVELDLLVNYRFSRHLTGYVGYSHFFTGAFIRATGPAKDADFGYAALQYTF